MERNQPNLKLPISRLGLAVIWADVAFCREKEFVKNGDSPLYYSLLESQLAIDDLIKQMDRERATV